MKFGWLADTHLDTVQYGMERRREDFEISFASAVQDMLDRKIRVIIHSGDLINSNRPSPRTMKFLQAIHDRLRAVYAVMLVVSGNHDRTTPHWVETLVGPDPYYGIQLLDFKTVKYMDKAGDPGLIIYGAPTMSAEQFRKHEFPQADVLVIHQMIKEFVDYEQHDVICLADIPPKYKLVAVGDVHVHKIIEQPGRPGCYIGYPGSTELKSETEDGNKVWIDCYLAPDGQLTLTPVPIVTRAVLRIDLTQQNVEIDVVIGQVVKWCDGHPHEREPIIFITYLNTYDQVMPKFKTAFNPDKFILRFKPVFGKVLTRTADGQVVEATDNLTVEDILRGEISTAPELFGIASQLIKSDVDESAALDEFIAGRLRELEKPTDVEHG
jgi:predicted phosphodiesterase